MLVVMCACALTGAASAPYAHTTNVRPLDARHSPYVGGNASPQLPTGHPGRIAVIARARYRAGDFAITVRNNTPTTVMDIRVEAVAISAASGKVVATGTSQGLHPFVVRPGEISFGYVYFPGTADSGFPPNTRFKLTTIRPSARTNFRDLLIAHSTLDQTLITGDGVTGVARNPRAVPLKTDSAIAACFTETGKLLYTYAQEQNQARVRPHGVLRFIVGVYDVCPVYLVAAAGRI